MKSMLVVLILAAVAAAQGWFHYWDGTLSRPGDDYGYALVHSFGSLPDGAEVIDQISFLPSFPTGVESGEYWIEIYNANKVAIADSGIFTVENPAWYTWEFDGLVVGNAGVVDFWIEIGSPSSSSDSYVAWDPGVSSYGFKGTIQNPIPSRDFAINIHYLWEADLASATWGSIKAQF